MYKMTFAMMTLAVALMATAPTQDSPYPSCSLDDCLAGAAQDSPYPSCSLDDCLVPVA